jgi:hypothetical protein
LYTMVYTMVYTIVLTRLNPPYCELRVIHSFLLWHFWVPDQICQIPSFPGGVAWQIFLLVKEDEEC